MKPNLPPTNLPPSVSGVQSNYSTSSIPEASTPKSELRWSNLIHFFTKEDPNWQKMTMKAIRGLDTNELVSAGDLLTFTAEEICRLAKERRSQLHPGVVLDAIKIAKEQSLDTSALWKLIPDSFSYFSKRTAAIAKAEKQAAKKEELTQLEKQGLPKPWLEAHNTLDKELKITPLTAEKTDLHTNLHMALEHKPTVADAACNIIKKEVITSSSSWLKCIHLAHVMRQDYALYSNGASKLSKLLHDSGDLTSEHLLLFSPYEIQLISNRIGTSLPQFCVKEAIQKSKDPAQARALLQLITDDHLKAVVRHVLPAKQEKIEDIASLLATMGKVDDTILDLVANEGHSIGAKIDAQFLGKASDLLLKKIIQGNVVLNSFTVLTAIRKANNPKRQELLIELYQNVSRLEKDGLEDLLSTSLKETLPAKKQAQLPPQPQLPTHIQIEPAKVEPAKPFQIPAADLTPLYPTAEERPESPLQEKTFGEWPLEPTTEVEATESNATEQIDLFCQQNPVVHAISVATTTSQFIRDLIQLNKELRSASKFRSEQTLIIEEAFKSHKGSYKNIQKLLAFLHPMKNLPAELGRYGDQDKIDWQMYHLIRWLRTHNDANTVGACMTLPLPDLLKIMTTILSQGRDYYAFEPYYIAFAQRISGALQNAATRQDAIDCLHAMQSEAEFCSDILDKMGNVVIQ